MKKRVGRCAGGVQGELEAADGEPACVVGPHLGLAGVLKAVA